MPAEKLDSVLVSVVRRSDGLFAYLVGRSESFSPPSIHPRDVGVDLGPADPYVERLVPLRDVPQARVHPLRSVLEAWEALGRVGRLDATVLERVRTVLDHTVLDGTADDADVPPLAFEPEPRPFRPTAANPRAYKGTKDRPPKVRRPRPLDLRPHLARPRDVGVLLRELGAKDPPSPPAVPAHFLRGFFPSLRAAPKGHLGRWLALYRGLDLDAQGPLRRALSRLAVLGPPALPWAELLLEMPPERRMGFVDLVLETGVATEACPKPVIRRAGELSSDLVFRQWTHALLQTLKTGGDVPYLLTGFELAQEYDDRHEFEPVGQSGFAPLEGIRAAVDHTCSEYLALKLWKACGAFDLARLIRSSEWRQLPPSTARRFLDLVTGLMYEDELSPDERSAKAATLEGMAESIVQRLLAMEERYQGKALAFLHELAWFWDRPDLLAGYLSDGLDLLDRICRPHFGPEGHAEHVLVVLTNFDESDWQRLRKAPDDVLRRIEAACRRRNDAELIAAGLHPLSRAASELTATGILRETSAVLRTAKVLGGLGRSLRKEVRSKWLAHPLLQVGVEGLSTKELVGLLVEEVPVSRKLKGYAKGEVQLTPAQVERGWRELLTALPTARWTLLRRLAVDRLASTLGPKDRGPNVLHAIRLYGNIDENRRALRRFLQAHFKGDREYLRRHPLNGAWLKALKRLDGRAWLEGMRLEGRLRDGRPLTLQVELDPIEALRLGTVVGSCTGLGGRFAFSAAAVVLDLNKHVVYARTAQGSVLARQLIGVSEDERLVCFEVYPTTASPELKRLFRDFDVAFAARLGVELHRPSSDDHAKVERLLSRDWWDDGAWDPEADEGQDTP
jgi:hypothetical protein